MQVLLVLFFFNNSVRNYMLLETHYFAVVNIYIIVYGQILCLNYYAVFNLFTFFLHVVVKSAQVSTYHFFQELQSGNDLFCCYC